MKSSRRRLVTPIGVSKFFLCHKAQVIPLLKGFPEPGIFHKLTASRNEGSAK